MWERVLNGPPLSASSDISVHPVLGVVKYMLALDMGVKAIVGDHASLAQVWRELAVEAMEDGALRRDLLGLSTKVRSASLVDDRGIVLNDICNRQKSQRVKFAQKDRIWAEWNSWRKKKESLTFRCSILQVGLSLVECILQWLYHFDSCECSCVRFPLYLWSLRPFLRKR